MVNEFRVLIVDDARAIRRIIRQAVEKEYSAIHIEEASHGKEAQQLLLRNRIDLILCDLDMPHMNGHELLLWVKQTPNLQSTPFILITAMRERESILNAMKAGAAAVLLKPFTIEDLAKKINEVTKVAQMRKHERFTVKGSGFFLSGTAEFRAAMIDISKGGLCCDFSKDAPIPHILDRVEGVLHLAGGRDLKGLAAQVIRLHVADDFAHSGNIRVAMVFQSLSSDADRALEHYINDRHLEAIALQHSAA